MYCSHCGAQNANDDLFCGSCGQRLSGEGTVNPAEDEELPPVMDSRAEFAMLRPPESEMRPLTKLAYDIHDSEQAKTISAVLSLIFVGLCVGVIANLLAIFEKMNKLTYSLKTSSGTRLAEYIRACMPLTIESIKVTQPRTKGQPKKGYFSRRRCRSSTFSVSPSSVRHTIACFRGPRIRMPSIRA